jgi:hypothetical protein
MSNAHKVYPSSAATIPQPVTFEMIFHDNEVNEFIRVVSASTFVSTGAGNSAEIAFLGLPSMTGGTFYTAATSLLDSQRYYLRMEIVYEVGGRFPGEYTTYIGGATSFDGESWDVFYTEAVDSTPTLEYPDDELQEVYLNHDWLIEMRWNDEDTTDYDDYTLWFYDPYVGEWVPRTDRSRYSITHTKMWLDYTLEYSTTYFWFVRKTIGGYDYDSDIWSFTTVDFKPPDESWRWKLPYGDPGGDPYVVPTGENNQLTVQRLCAVAANKFYYEDV